MPASLSNEREKALGQSYEGRLWDVIFLASYAVRRSGNQDRCSFEVSLFEAEATPPHRTRRCTLSLWMVVGPGDQGEPVITIGFPEDFYGGSHDWKDYPRLAFSLREHLLPRARPQGSQPANAVAHNKSNP